MRFNFDALTSASHTITVDWTGDADVRFNVFDETTGAQLNSAAVQGNNPGIWSGDLIAGQPYSVRVWPFSGIADVTVSIEAIVPIDIVSQPENRFVIEGDSASFFVEATGSGTLTYQWFVNDILIDGETSDSLAVLNAALTDDGSMYSVDISNGVNVLRPTRLHGHWLALHRLLILTTPDQVTLGAADYCVSTIFCWWVVILQGSQKRRSVPISLTDLSLPHWTLSRVSQSRVFKFLRRSTVLCVH